MNQQLVKSLKRATRKDLLNFMCDAIGYREDELEDWSMADMREAILTYEIEDNQGDQFGGFTF